ncbi:UvrD-helicase domain-containing protein [Vibrio sp. 99-8-1]|uniref:UvrD-helicase domain-containing protein n=1 Tax=Vibrio sp. 99-8-1 TaxID=2607602 RepID=UPI0014933295|nr:UvrD-helicase domain-containing protein [Vibrio sp. 99-8-1]NOI65195.1 ATP-dependent helicase [Vibrio sp. 99-8-1]
MNSNEIKEQEIQDTLFECIDNHVSFRFDSGAGSGKTYSLVECLRYLVKNKLNTIINHNQKIACITYTNVAVKEIRERIGTTDTIEISTIHERLWNIIRIYQPQLVSLHKNKLELELQAIEKDLNNNDKKSKYKLFAELESNERDDFVDYAYKTEDLFYKSQNLKAADFKKSYKDYIDIPDPDCLTSIISNVANFKSIIRLIYRKRRYQVSIDKITEGVYNRVDYDSASNQDRLGSMKFSHDTLLEYSYEMIRTYPILKKVIIDKYPFVFVDEYQDTAKSVVLIMKELHDYSALNGFNWLVGYFGDTAQNIYGSGIGKNIETYHNNLHIINKEFNRRSHEQVINIINKVRNDHICQVPFSEKREGNVKFYYSSENNQNKLDLTNVFLSEYKRDIGNEKIDCLVLTNKIMCQLNKFGDIYDTYSKFESVYFDNVNTELLSKDRENLSPIISQVYLFIKLYEKLYNPNTSYYDILGDTKRKITFNEANSLINQLRDNSYNSLLRVIRSVSNIALKNQKNPALDPILRHNLNLNRDDFSDYGSIEKYIKSQLYSLAAIRNTNTDSSNSDDEYNKKSSLAESFLSISIEQWLYWFNFLNQTDELDIKYHTYHGTKGEEYDNVAIIMEHSFGNGHKGKNKFKNYFHYLQSNEEEQKKILEDESAKIELDNTRNLLYVVCSRSIKNLRLLYLDDISDISEGIESIFVDVHEWKKVNN